MAASASAVESARWDLRVHSLAVISGRHGPQSGVPTGFIRLSGCPQRCVWCDAPEAFHGGTTLSQVRLLEHVAGLGVSAVCVSGGEPLAQRGTRSLLSALCARGIIVALETSCAQAIDQIDERVLRVVDIKTPGSRESHRNRLGNLDLLRSDEYARFVIADRADFDWASALIAARGLTERTQVVFAACAGSVAARSLSAWVDSPGAPAVTPDHGTRSSDAGFL